MAGTATKKKKGLFSTGILSKLKNKSRSEIERLDAQERGMSSLRPANIKKNKKPKTKKLPMTR